MGVCVSHAGTKNLILSCSKQKNMMSKSSLLKNRTIAHQLHLKNLLIAHGHLAIWNMAK